MKLYSKFRTHVRLAEEMFHPMFFKNTDNEISLRTYIDQKKVIPLDFIARPFAVHHTALSDIISFYSDEHIVSERLKLLLEEFYIPNVEFFKVPVCVGRLSNSSDYETFKFVEGNYYYMINNEIEISNIDIDFENSDFLYFKSTDNQYGDLPRNIKFNSEKDFTIFISKIGKSILTLFTFNLVLFYKKKISDVLVFPYNTILFNQEIRQTIFSNDIIKEFKKRKFKGIIEHLTVIHVNNNED